MNTAQAQHAAKNLDGFMDSETVRNFAKYVGNGTRPIAQAAAIFPNEYVEKIDGYKPIAPIGRLSVTIKLRAYAWNKATAMDCRKRGDITAALMYENICERIYKDLPAWAKW